MNHFFDSPRIMSHARHLHMDLIAKSKELPGGGDTVLTGWDRTYTNICTVLQIKGPKELRARWEGSLRNLGAGDRLAPGGGMNEQQRCRCFSTRLGSIPNNRSCPQNMRSCHLAPTTWCPGRTGALGVPRGREGAADVQSPSRGSEAPHPPTLL